MVDSYYRNQAQLPYFSGAVRQRGSGFGSVVLGVGRATLPLLSRSVAPVAKKVAKKALPVVESIGKELLAQAIPELLNVVSKKKSAKSALKSAVKTAVKKQIGGGRKGIKGVLRNNGAISGSSRKKRSRSDFFAKIKNGDY